MFERFPTREAILRLSAGDLAPYLLLALQGDSLNRHNFMLTLGSRYGTDDAVVRVFLAAWAFLVRLGFLVEKSEPGWFFVSPEGEAERRRLQASGIPEAPEHRVVAGRWIVERPLSGGGQGVTSLVYEIGGSNDERFVLKELKHDDGHARQRFAAELRALKALDHPNILRIVDFASESEPPWYVSEFCAGHGLDKAVLKDIPVPARLQIFLDVCAGLAAAHENGITHRDVKPENVLLKSSGGPAVLGDFGICWFVEADDERLTVANEDIGSSFCRAPELFDGPAETVLPSSDVYCLGKLLYWLLAGMGGRTGRLRAEEFERDGKNLVTLFDDSGYEHINAILRRMIVEDPLARFATAKEVLVAAVSAFDLFTKGYAPTDRPPRNCNYCGQGRYEEHPQSAMISVEQALWRDSRVFECATCGHTLYFRRTSTNSSW